MAEDKLKKNKCEIIRNRNKRAKHNTENEQCDCVEMCTSAHRQNIAKLLLKELFKVVTECLNIRIFR